MKTPRSGNTKVTKLEEKTSYYYFGIAETLKKYSIFLSHTEHIKLNVFIDGVEGDNSTGLVHWPILAKILEIRVNIIFPIALHTGHSKPKNVETYLRDFTDEAIRLHTEGVLIKECMREFSIIRILGDAPARALFLNTVGHNAFGHCVFCNIWGANLNYRNYFYDNSMLSLERSSEQFYAVEYPELQKGPTPLMEIQHINLLEDCPYDPMHMLMRILKTLLGFLTKPEKNKIRKSRAHLYQMTDGHIDAISRRLSGLRAPVEFQKQRLDTFRRNQQWKASLCRFFLLYVGPIFLRGRVSREVFRNFLLLHFSFRVLSATNSNPSQMECVRPHLEDFVRTFGEIYGIETIGHYMHGLLHLVDQAKKHGPLDSYAVYLFESYLGIFKHFKHGPRYPAQQLVNRIIERQVSSRDIYLQNKRSTIFPDSSQYDGPFPADLRKEDFHTYSRINLECCSLNVKRDSDNLILLQSGTIFRVQNILHHRQDNNTFLFGYPLMRKTNMYTYPESSATVGIFRATDNEVATYFQEVVLLTDFASKCVCVPLGNEEVAAIRMLH